MYYGSEQQQKGPCTTTKAHKCKDVACKMMSRPNNGDSQPPNHPLQQQQQQQWQCQCRHRSLSKFLFVSLVVAFVTCQSSLKLMTLVEKAKVATDNVSDGDSIGNERIPRSNNGYNDGDGDNSKNQDERMKIISRSSSLSSMSFYRR